MADVLPSPKSWDERYDELLEFIEQHARFPSRHDAMNGVEASLGWWVKDQRRKMRHPYAIGKRGGLTLAQVELLRDIGVFPEEPGAYLRVEKPAKGRTRATTPAGKRPRGRPPGTRSEKPVVAWYREGVDPPRNRLWLRRMEQLRMFLEAHGRPPSTDYTSSPSEVKLARWVQRVAKELRRPHKAFPLTEAEASILAKAGVKGVAAQLQASRMV